MSAVALERIGSLSSVQFGNHERVVLFLYPPGEERKGCVRLVWQVAQLLDKHGWSTVAFDYYGDGDSPGEFADMSLVTLGEDISRACAWAKERYREVRLCALRLGCRLGLEFAEPELKMVLVAPVFDGAKWLTETRRRSRFREGDCPVAEGDIDGYRFSSEFLDGLQALPQVAAQRVRGDDVAGNTLAILSFGAGSNPPAMLKTLAGEHGAALSHLKGLPFWLQAEPGEYGGLPGEIARLCMEK